MKSLLSLIIVVFCVQFSFSQNAWNMVRSGHWDPPNMPATSGGNEYNDCWGYTTSTGEEYAIIGSIDSIIILDITDCSNPTRIYAYDGGDQTVWRDFKVFGDYVYAVCDVNCNEGLHIFDMSALPNGNVTHELTTTAFFTKAHNIYIDVAGERLYACGVPGATDLIVLDLSVTPENPTLISNIDFNTILGGSTNYYIHDLYVRNDTVYASHGYTGFYVWDMVDVNNISLLGSEDTGDYNHSSWPSDNHQYAFFAEEVPKEQPLGVLDLANIHNASNPLPQVATFQHRIGNSGYPTPHNPYVKNDTLYVSHYEDGLKVWDVTNPLTPNLIAYYDTYPQNTSYTGYEGNWGTYPFFDSGCIIATDIENGLNVLEFQFVPPCDSINAYYTNPIPPGLIQHVRDDIIIDATLPSGFPIELKAGNSIEMPSGFETPMVTNYEADIAPCDDTNTPLLQEEMELVPEKN